MLTETMPAKTVVAGDTVTHCFHADMRGEIKRIVEWNSKCREFWMIDGSIYLLALDSPVTIEVDDE